IGFGVIRGVVCAQLNGWLQRDDRGNMSLHGLADGARDSDGMFASFNDDALMEQLLEVWRISEFRLRASGNHAAASPRNRGEDLALLNAEGSNIFDAEVRLVQEH